MRRVVRSALCAAAVVAVPGLALGDPAHPAPRTAAKAPSARPQRPVLGRAAAARIWHTPAADKAPPVDANGRPLLALKGLNIPDYVELPARSDRGGFAAEDLDRAAHVLREPSSGNEHPIDPHLLDLVYRVQVHFHAQEIRIISGYRTPRHGGHSNHGRGRAMDLVVPGAGDEEVARFAREQGFVGVGVYPVSGFVHIDVRERSFFWIDRSGPGKRSRLRGVLADLAAKSDRAALARGERSVGPFVIGGDVDAAIVAASGTTGAPDDDEDVD